MHRLKPISVVFDNSGSYSDSDGDIGSDIKGKIESVFQEKHEQEEMGEKVMARSRDTAFLTASLAPSTYLI